MSIEIINGLIGTGAALLGSGFLLGFLPGVLLRPFLWIFPKESERPEEILGELYSLPYRKRITWAFQNIEVAIFEGIRERWHARRQRFAARRRHDATPPRSGDPHDYLLDPIISEHSMKASIKAGDIITMIDPWGGMYKAVLFASPSEAPTGAVLRPMHFPGNPEPLYPHRIEFIKRSDCDNDPGYGNP